MFCSEEMQDAIKSMFDEAKREFMGRNFPDSQLSSFFLIQCLEFQSSMLKLYRKSLDDIISNDPLEEISKQMAKSYMSVFMEMMKLQRESRKTMLKYQFEFIENYLHTIEDIIRNINKEKERHRNHSGRTDSSSSKDKE